MRPALLLPVIVFAQFAGTSLWFAGNAAMAQSPLSADLAAMVQFGFIAGTLLFALAGLADRFSSSRVFLYSSLLAAGFNLLPLLSGSTTTLFISRGTTGFFLAGIYPVGMKIASDHFEGRLGNALGFLVGALVLGSAFPYLLLSAGYRVDGPMVLVATSVLAVAGGLLIGWLVAPGQGKRLQVFSWRSLTEGFRVPDVRAAAFGYFGHMWELYALWAFVPFIARCYNELHATKLPEALFSFGVIGAGSLGCVLGGRMSLRWGSKKLAFVTLLISGCCSLLSPLILQLAPALFLPVMFIWGMTLAADSPQFSTMVARSAPASSRGTALTAVTCIGFAVTVLSIQLMKVLTGAWGYHALSLLFIGPLLGCIALRKYASGQ